MLKEVKIIILLIFLAVTACSCSQDNKIYIVENGVSSYSIVIPENPSEDIKNAVKLFRNVIKDSTGASFNVFQDEDPDGISEKEIRFGKVNRSDYNSLGSVLLSYSYSVSKNIIQIEGNGDGAYVTAVNEILREIVNYNPNDRTYNKNDSAFFTVKNNKKTVTGSIEYQHGNQTLDESFFEEGMSYKMLKYGKYQLLFNNKDGFELSLVDSEKKITPFLSEYPVCIRIIDKKQTIGNDFSSEKEYKTKYENVIRSSDGYTAVGEIVSENGSKIRITDSFYLNNGVICFDRKVQVINESRLDAGYQSVFSIESSDGGVNRDNFEYFIPGLLFKDTTYMETTNGFGGALFSDLNNDRIYSKTTSTPTPSAMLRCKKTGYTLSVQNIHPNIGTVDTPITIEKERYNGYKVLCYVTDEAKYGAIGYSFNQNASIDFVYPSTEGPYTYENKNFSWICKYSSLSKTKNQAYTIALNIEKYDSFNDAMINSYLKSYILESPEYRNLNIEKLYNDQMTIYDSLFTEYSSSDGKVKSAGLYFDASVKTGKPYSPISYLFGFSGAQGLSAFQMYREGLINNNNTILDKAVKILDFWSSDTINSGALPIVWWVPNTTSGGNSNNYVSYLRVFIDGMEALADAYNLSVQYGQERENWLKAAIKTADFLVNNQSADGTWCRAYYTSGSPTRIGKLLPGEITVNDIWGGYDGKSPLASECAVRFLYKIYNITGEIKYAEAAKKAAEWAYNKLYLEMGKYVGVCPDHINIVDKESAIYAMYCFLTAYDLTNDSKYIKAAEHSAITAMSFVYIHDFSAKNTPKQYEGVNILLNGGIMGTSIIATGYSTTDVYSSVTYSDYYELYKITNNSDYLNLSKFLQSNTKSLADTDGKMGWFTEGVSLEATNGVTNIFSTAGDGVWLPWISSCFCDPYIDLYTKYGCGDVFKID